MRPCRRSSWPASRTPTPTRPGHFRVQRATRCRVAVNSDAAQRAPVFHRAGLARVRRWGPRGGTANGLQGSGKVVQAVPLRRGELVARKRFVLIHGGVMSGMGRRVSPALVQQGEWLTVSGCKRVLVVVHTMAYAHRLREVFSLFESDFRVQVVFTVAPHAFDEGVATQLRQDGVDVIPWRAAVRSRFDLALAAGGRGTEQVQAPLIRLSHGAGQIKLQRGATVAGEPRVPGMLSRQQLMHQGRVVPTVIAFSHMRDVQALERSCPEALAKARVIGDPVHDRLVASSRMRKEYRRRLGLREGQQLVVVATTWGTSSSFGRFDALLPRLLTELPGDRYRIALMSHPNVWAGHGRWQVHGWLAECRRRGLVVVPPEVDWIPLLVSADFVIGDHGSLTAYSSVADVPVILARFPEQGVAVDSPAALLASLAPALSPWHPLQDQLSYAAVEHRAQDYAPVVESLSSEPGRFHRLTRTLMYQLLRLGEPAYAPRVAAAALPPPLSEWEAGDSGMSA